MPPNRQRLEELKFDEPPVYQRNKTYFVFKVGVRITNFQGQVLAAKLVKS